MVDVALFNEWMAVPPEELAARSRIPLRVLPTADDVHRDFADTMFNEFQDAGREGREISIILPLGPTDHFPMLAERVNRERLALDHVSMFGMDNWLDWQGRMLPIEDPRSFEGHFHRLFIDRVDPALRPRPENVIFPSSQDLDAYSREIERRGKITTTYGGIGFQGHVGFNEPPSSRWTTVTLEQLRDSSTRIVPISIDTMIVMAQRIAGGNVFAIPPFGVTVGMRDILGADRIRLYSSGGKMKRAILRIVLFSEPTVDFPATLVQEHRDVEIIIEAEATKCPLPAL
jgi:glucosamine-6-phosphate deaminase